MYDSIFRTKGKSSNGGKVVYGDESVFMEREKAIYEG
jgi:hypothetical protein